MRKLLKYKSLSGDSATYAIDIILKSRLYLCSFEELNDPLEGSFLSDETSKDLKTRVYAEKSSLGICSLSDAKMHPLMWSHYADGYKGICIEVEVNDSPLTLHRMNYNLLPPKIHERGRDYDLAIAALTSKRQEWSYEQEYRIIHENGIGYHYITVTKITLGLRISDCQKGLIREIADTKKIPVYASIPLAGYTIGEHGPI